VTGFDPQTIHNESLRRLYDYWNGKRAGREFPSRADLDPLELRWIVGNLLLLDVQRDPPRFRFRVMAPTCRTGSAST
jgi:hypothetical protein